MSTINVILPPIFAQDEKLWKQNRVVQLHVPSLRLEAVVKRYDRNRVKGYLFTPVSGERHHILALTNSASPPEDFSMVLRLKFGWTMDTESDVVDLEAGKWLRHPELHQVSALPSDDHERLAQVRASWIGAFTYLQEDPSKSLSGLRTPQLGAVHAVHSHWTISNEAATVVMPTGTGKTETMLAVLLTADCPRILVVVPTDALRTQIAQKFTTLGVLKEIGVLAPAAHYPVVGVLQNKPQTVPEVDAIFEKCHVVVSTMHIAGQCDDAIQKRMAELCPYLFIDEAHHVAAQTWERLKESFSDRRILQFTATPFRNDNRHVGGKIIFNYPLQKAQEEGYFREIRFKPVREFDLKQADKVIADAAIRQLREDLEAGYDHILMARVGSIRRAEQVFAIYEQACPEFNPVQIHTGIQSQQARGAIKEKILKKDTRIVVCVDMLGEGFDLPELKIAAFHDVRKSLPVTIQLTGRFTRAKSELGKATIIANIANITVREELRKLYAQNSDWNILMRQGSAEAIGEQVALREFLEGFSGSFADLQLELLRPAKNVLVYRTECDEWHPQDFWKGLNRQLKDAVYISHDTHFQRNTLVIMFAQNTKLRWTQEEEIQNLEWEMLILFWNKQQQLLFIHSSNSKSGYRELAQAVVGSAQRFRGVNVFRCFSGINRLRLHNVGLTKLLGRLISYTMRAGSDVASGLAEAQKRNTIKTNIFGSGFKQGPVTYGCSQTGRFWSNGNVNIRELTLWCTQLGEKILNEAIDPNDVLAGTLVPVQIGHRPSKMPFAVDWPKTILVESDTTFEFVIDSDSQDRVSLPLYETELVLITPDVEGILRFAIRSEILSIPIRLILSEENGLKDFKFLLLNDQVDGVSISRDGRPYPLVEFLHEHPPVIWFADGSSLEGNTYTELPEQYSPYPAEKIECWDWSGVNIRRESQGVTKGIESIQYHVFKVLREREKTPYNILFDDDDAGESADVVGIYAAEKTIFVEFYHCKYSRGDQPGARIADLYEVCGQAQKSVHWLSKISALFTHLFVRDPRKKQIKEAAVNGGEEIKEYSRFEAGDRDELHKLMEMSHSLEVRFRIFIVQPGLSASEVSHSQRELLSVTENYLRETYNVPFGVIASA